MLRLYQTKTGNAIYNEPSSITSSDTILKKIKYAFERAFSFSKAKRHKRSRKPWITEYLFKRINERNELYDAFIRTKDINTLIEYKKIRNELNCDIKKSRANYSKSKFIANQHNRKKVQKTAKELMSNLSSTIPSVLRRYDVDYSCRTFANLFNSHILYSGDPTSSSFHENTLYVNTYAHQYLYFYHQPRRLKFLT